jgi:hypothetical protein
MMVMPEVCRNAREKIVASWVGMSGLMVLSGLADDGFQRYQHQPVDNAVDSLSGSANIPRLAVVTQRAILNKLII